MQLSADVAAAAAGVRFLLLDVDGVLTDGRIHLLPAVENDEVKTFHVRDGLGIRLLQKVGIDVGLLSGRSATTVTRRARELGIREIHQGVSPKLPVYLDLLSRLRLEESQICYVGDDIVDLPLLRRVGLPATVADAHPEVIAAARLVSSLPGGGGAVREIAEGLLRAQGKWEQAMESLLQ